MKLFMRDEYELRGTLIADVDPREVEAIFDMIRRQGVYAAEDYYADFSWQFCCNDDGAYAEIVLHSGEE